ncbi:SDR family oxidoreductase [Methylovorus sp. SPW-M1]
MLNYGITGATGQLGRKVIAGLNGLVQREQVVAIARDPVKAANLGVPVRTADYMDRQGLATAFEGLDTLLLISSSSFDSRQVEHHNVIEAAKEVGVRRILYTSLLHADHWGVSFAEDHLATEGWIKASGLEFTILRNGWYWENHTASLLAALEHGAIVSGCGDASISWAARQDYADAAIKVLIEEGHQGKTYELAGDTAYTLTDLAAEAASQSRKPLRYHYMDESSYADFLHSIGLPWPVCKLLAEIESRGINSGGLVDESRALANLIDRPTMTLAEAVAKSLENQK